MGVIPNRCIMSIFSLFQLKTCLCFSLSATFFPTLEASPAFCLSDFCLLDSDVALLCPSVCFVSCGSCGTVLFTVFHVLRRRVVFNNETQREAQRDLQCSIDLKISSVALAMLGSPKNTSSLVQHLTSVGISPDHPLDFKLGFNENLFSFSMSRRKSYFIIWNLYERHFIIVILPSELFESHHFD